VRALDPAYRLGSEGLGDGDVVELDGLEVRVVATPGHTADSLSFLVPAERAVLTGDTVLGRGTTVVAHPDGQLGAYLDSLDRLHALAEAHEVQAIWPGHGAVIEDALGALDFYLAHRRERLAQVEAAVARLGAGTAGPVGPPGPIGDDLPRRVVELVYQDVDPVLWGAAELSVRAQLAYLAGRG
jgi:glyoxylase-like metal-dependent hydrolase (beta-lactamase superfamily II)